MYPAQALPQPGQQAPPHNAGPRLLRHPCPTSPAPTHSVSERSKHADEMTLCTCSSWAPENCSGLGDPLDPLLGTQQATECPHTHRTLTQPFSSRLQGVQRGGRLRVPFTPSLLLPPPPNALPKQAATICVLLAQAKKPRPFLSFRYSLRSVTKPRGSEHKKHRKEFFFGWGWDGGDCSIETLDPRWHQVVFQVAPLLPMQTPLCQWTTLAHIYRSAV